MEKKIKEIEKAITFAIDAVEMYSHPTVELTTEQLIHKAKWEGILSGLESTLKILNN